MSELLAGMAEGGAFAEAAPVEVGSKLYPDVKHSAHNLHIDGGSGEIADVKICGEVFNHVLTSMLLYLDEPDGGKRSTIHSHD